VKISKRVNKYFQDQAHQLVKALEEKESVLLEKDFHAIRVSIKRIKALFSLLDEMVPSFRLKKFFSPYKTLFRQAGKIRDLQVQLGLLVTFPGNAAINSMAADLNRQLTDEKVRFYKMNTKSLIRRWKKSEQKILDAIKKNRRKKINRYLKKKQKRVLNLLQKDQLDVAQIHGLRKRIKDIYYLQSMMGNKKIWFGKMDQFQDLLGKWHDGRVLLQGLEKHLNSSSLQQEEKDALKWLSAKLDSQNKNFYLTILKDKADVEQLFIDPH
jgi:CHAD domain-containing protein